MAIRDIFSKRQQRLRGEMPDVYQYSELPRPFRAQVVHIWEDAFGNSLERGFRPRDIYQRIHDQVCREYGWFALSADTPPTDRRMGVIKFLLDTEDTEKALDVVETGFRVINTTCRDDDFRETAQPKIRADAAIRELNTRFREHGIGYQFEAGQLVRLDAKVVHDEAVRPALQLLSARRYAGANAEYLAAHEHYRHARHKESLSESLKALESVLKVICETQGWQYEPTDPAKRPSRRLFQSWTRATVHAVAVLGAAIIAGKWCPDSQEQARRAWPRCRTAVRSRACSRIWPSANSQRYSLPRGMRERPFMNRRPTGVKLARPGFGPATELPTSSPA